MKPTHLPLRLLATALPAALLLSACAQPVFQPGAGTAATPQPASTAPSTAATAANSPSTAAPTGTTGGSSGSQYLGSYQLADSEFGTMTTVNVTSTTRTIETNALPDHETGTFPNSGNPNAIAAQDLTWTFPVTPTWTGVPTEPRVPGVALNGVKFEPATAETITCESGETYRVEAIQDLYSLGLDFNNAHVQPSGEYHYHGISELLVEAKRQAQGRVKLIVDSGFRRGTDILKAYALGADLVMCGRAALFGIAAGAEAGAQHAMDLLKAEVLTDLGLIGAPTIGALDASFVDTRDLDERLPETCP